jgi:ribosomal-protein-alanine N-acetyltransferase
MNEDMVEAVAALEAVCFSTPWSEASIRSELENPYSIWLVALEEEKLAGYLGVQFGPDGGDIMTIATDPEFRGRGVGKRLLKTMVQKLQEKNLQWLTLEVRPSNAPALKLYEAFGFRQVGRRPNYYKNPREDALLLTKFFEEEIESC